MLVARDDPLDTYLVHHPEALFGAPVEATVLDPANPYVLGPQLCLRRGRGAAHPGRPGALRRRPRRRRSTRWSPPGALRQRPDRLVLDGTASAPRSTCAATGGAPVCVVEAATGRLLGTVDARLRRTSLLHPGAVYLHQGVSYVVDDLDLADAVRAGARRGAGLVHPRPRRHRPVGGVGAVLRGRRAGRRCSSARWT